MASFITKENFKELSLLNQKTRDEFLLKYRHHQIEVATHLLPMGTRTRETATMGFQI